jgi:hypothetical protein
MQDVLSYLFHRGGRGGLPARPAQRLAAGAILALGVVLLPFTSKGLDEDGPGLGPLFDTFPLTLADGTRTEAAGPFYYQEQQDTQSTWAVPPLLSSVRDPATESQEFDFVYPVLTYDRFGSEYRFQIIQLFSFSGGGLQSGETEHRFTLFPLYFQQRSPDTNENYTALFPLHGTLKNRLFRDRIDFTLWPLYVKTIRRQGFGTVGADEFLALGNRWARHSRRGDFTTYNFIAPIFHLRYGDGLHGWQAWPVAGHEVKMVTTRTNAWGDAESIPGYEKTFIAWPFWFNETRDIGTTNTAHFSALLPFYSKLRSPGRDSTSYLWPCGLTLTDDRLKQYHETDVLWPIFVYARGAGKTSTRVWPLFGRARSELLESDFYLWPLYKYNRLHSDPLDRERTRILFILYSDKRERNTETGKASRRIDCWPLFTHTRDFEGRTRLQIFSLFEPIVSTSKSVDRNDSPVWSVWRAENNPVSGASSQSLLWNLYRHHVTADGRRRTSFLFGLFEHQRTPNGTGLRLFFIPFKSPAPKPPDAAKVASPPQMTHSAGVVHR